MEPIPSPQPQPGQTIVIDRRDRGGWFRRLIGPVLLLTFGFCLLGSFLVRDQVPMRLTEHYVAGEISGPKVAIVEVEGAITDASAETAIKAIRQARDDDQVRAVVLRVESPGGSASASDRIWRELNLVRDRGKPVVASMGGMAASGGYYVSAPADRIFAEPTTLTGSIGVKLQFFQGADLMKKLGVAEDTVASGDWKDSGSMFKPMTEPERKRWRELVEDIHQRFVRVVAQGRKLPLSQAKAVADGRVFTAAEALGLKLIDEVGYLDDAIRHAQNLAKIETSHVVRYARPTGLSDLLDALPTSRPSTPLTPESLLPFRAPQVLLMVR